VSGKPHVEMLYLNPISALICEQVDAANGYETIVFEWGEDYVYKIDPFGYWILREIVYNPGIEKRKLVEMLVSIYPAMYSSKFNQILRFIEFLLTKEVLLSEAPVWGENGFFGKDE